MTSTNSVTGAPSVPGIDVRRVAGSLGAEIRGVRVGTDLPGPVVKLIRDALLEHKVIFFRGQDHLDDAGQAGFARLNEIGYQRNRTTGGLILIDEATNATVGAAMITEASSR